MQTLKTIIGAKWDRSARSNLRNWWDSEYLRHYISEQICGEAGLEWGVPVALRRHLGDRRLPRGLSIGCGNSYKEMALLKAGTVERFDLLDFSPLIASGAEAALAQHGLSERAAFLEANPLESPARRMYDLIYWDHSLHHMSDVRATLEWCRASLLPGGIVCINDYVGPSRLQWTGDEVEAVNEQLRRLEAKYGIQIPKTRKGNILRRLRQIVKDPSEAPESHLIEQAASIVFSGFRLRPLGGAMLNIGGVMVMNLPAIPPGLIEDFAAADQKCLADGVYHFAFGIWQPS